MVKPFLINVLYWFSLTIVMRMVAHVTGVYEVLNPIASIFAIAICSVAASLLIEIIKMLKSKTE
jgi:hypothetical protein